MTRWFGLDRGDLLFFIGDDSTGYMGILDSNKPLQRSLWTNQFLVECQGFERGNPHGTWQWWFPKGISSWKAAPAFSGSNQWKKNMQNCTMCFFSCWTIFYPKPKILKTTFSNTQNVKWWHPSLGCCFWWRAFQDSSPPHCWQVVFGFRV